MTHNPWRSLAALTTGVLAATNGHALGHLGQPVAIIVSGLVVAVDAIVEAVKSKPNTSPVKTDRLLLAIEGALHAITSAFTPSPKVPQP